MFLQDGIGIVRPLALTDRFKARRLRRKVQPADAASAKDAFAGALLIAQGDQVLLQGA